MKISFLLPIHILQMYNTAHIHTGSGIQTGAGTQGVAAYGPQPVRHVCCTVLVKKVWKSAFKMASLSISRVSSWSIINLTLTSLQFSNSG